MKQDIRDLFKRDEFPKKKLPTSHEEDFIKKLKIAAQKGQQKKKVWSFLKVVAVIALLISVTMYLNREKVQETALEAQFKEIEKESLKSIDKEWKALLKATDDQQLIKKYEEKLQRLDTSYQKISQQFKKDPNSISVLESLVDNLQRRLQLLKNIKEHIKELQQKNISNETIYI